VCRLYGFLATDPTRVECSLIEAQNALLVQSEQDRRGVPNRDGWGLAAWSDGQPIVERRARSAHEDLKFLETARSTHSTAVISHVRAATVGGADQANTHPFRHGPWVFAHNGTVSSFDRVAPLLDPGAFGPPEGDTDSELVFRWLLSRMKEFGLDTESEAPGTGPIVRLLSAAVYDIVEMTKTVGARNPAKLNFVVSDGKHLAASRWGNSLFWTMRHGMRDCTACGLSHCPDADESYRAVVIASEPITNERWQEVQEGSIVAVDEQVNLTTTDLLVRAA
jgi:glutamine amidotransferase